jgi:hypothetical protein
MRIHGHSPHRKMSPTYISWVSMVTRCHNKNHNSYPEYGGRGFSVCERWRGSFAAFLNDMGERPKNTTLDRHPNRSGNYEPGNCRWATHQEQQRNRDDVRTFTAEGKTLYLSDWSKLKGLTVNTLHARLRRGWELNRALNTPQGPWGSNRFTHQ